MEMGMGSSSSSSDQYGLADLRQLMAGRPLFPAGYPPPGEQLPGHRSSSSYYDHSSSVIANTDTRTTIYEERFRSCNTDGCSNGATTTRSAVNFCGNNNDGGLEMMEEQGCNAVGGGGGGGGGNTNYNNNNGRWPRQETLTLLEIRSGLDSKFKEANQKGPLWDEVSRIMAEQHGYQRSGKKCREKFENLYKYYKKTKEGKSGRQDGKHYRFFRQLEALYGDNTSSMSSLLLSPEPYILNAPISNTTSTATRFPNYSIIQEATLQTHHHQQNKLSTESQSISISSEFDTSSSEDDVNVDNNDFNVIAMRESNCESLNIENNGNKLMMMMKEISPSLKRGRGSWKAKIREFIDYQMKKLIDTQEAWLEKMLRTLEQKEHERMVREEEWRKQEEARIDQEHKFWAKERAWFEARDAALMEALKKVTGGKELITTLSPLQAMLMRTTTNHVQENNGDNGPNYANDQDESEMIKNDIRGEIRWEEDEVSSLIQIRSNMDHRFQQEEDDSNGDEYFERALWEEVSAKMACLGYDRSLKRCKEKWENINECLRRRPSNKECNYKKRKENAKLSKSCCYFPSIGDQEEINFCNDHDQSTSDQLRGPRQRSALHHYHHCGSNNAGNAMQDSCFRFLMQEAAAANNLWENYCSSSATTSTTIKFNKEENE